MQTGSRRLTFEDHRRVMEALKFVYPVLSRRAKGISLGVNLNPDKACNFDCIYCQVDRTVPGQKGFDLGVMTDELSRLLAWVREGVLFEHPPFDTVSGPMRRVNDICFAGDGEPTSAPEFLAAVEAVVKLKQQFGLDALKIVLITNATLLHRPAVRKALSLMADHQGEVWAKLDAGTEAWYNTISVTRVPFSRILKNLLEAAQVRPLVIQSLFLEYEGQGPSDAEVDAYIARLQHILDQGGQLKLIQVYTIARQTPSPGIYSLTDVQLDGLVARIQAALPVPVEGYYGSGRFMRPPPQLNV